ncbi:ABC transporter ATP-binding protein/permease [Microvirga sp. W0021]|uniref:ABC transporter ATP-binding protein/permease n=1 Tax=Hohaiivirga grylli TaxID=3133970 RepID=A0ABV0BIX8_9HYPH
MMIIAYALIALGIGFVASNLAALNAAMALPAAEMSVALASVLIIPLSSFLLAGVTLAARRIPRFLGTFIGTLGITHIVLVVLLLADTFNVVPFGWNAYVPPSSMAIAAAVASALIYACSYIPVIRTILSIGDRFYRAQEPSELSLGFLGTIRAKEGTIAVGLLAVIIAINLIQVALSVRLNFFSRDLFNALQTKDASAFWFQILFVFCAFAAIWVVVGLMELITRYFMQIRWRSYLNRYYVNNWLGDGVHYEMQLIGKGTDNPDQRITDDLKSYVQSTLDLSIQILNQVATLVSFVIILWGLSAGFSFPGTDFPVPGLLVWVAILYAGVGTWLIHMIGRPLINLNFKQEQVEADYRFSLARIREYSEQIALLKGQGAEAEGLHQKFGAIVSNYMNIAWRMMKITTFRFSFMQANVVFPYLLVAPYYFIGKITLGQMQQTAGAFANVQDAFNFFITAYTILAAYKAVINRLTSFETAMKGASQEQAEQKSAVITTANGNDISLDNVAVRLPDGHELIQGLNTKFRKGEAVLLTGPSGSGKSTLFRTLAGIWPFSGGTIGVPQDDRLMELPQKPYIPQGSLRDAVSYPATSGTYSDDEIKAALEAAKLGQFTEHLDDMRVWNQTLSLGEQQRISVARALLAKPDWLLLDEATAALDEKTEEDIYGILRSALPETTLISIGHRSTLHAYHDRRLELEKGGDGKPVITDVAMAH